MASDTRDRMLQATSELVLRHGYKASSLNDVLEAASAPRGSLYHHFPGGKEQLVLEATRRGVERVTDALEVTMAASGPIAGVRAYIDAIATELRGSDYGFGCPIAPVILDDPGADSELAELCRDTLRRWREIYAYHLEAAGADPSRSISLAIMIIAAVEGAILMARAERDATALDVVADDLAALIEGALAQADR